MNSLFLLASQGAPLPLAHVTVIHTLRSYLFCYDELIYVTIVLYVLKYLLNKRRKNCDCRHLEVQLFQGLRIETYS